MIMKVRGQILESIAGLVVSLAVLVYEAKILLLDTRILLVNDPKLLLNPTRLAITVAFLASVIALPVTMASLPGALSELIALYRRYALRSLRRVNISSIRLKLSLTSFSIPLATLAIVATLIYVKNPLLLLASSIPLILIVLLLLEPLLKVWIHAKALENELPWFVVLLGLVEEAGVDVAYLFRRIRETRILPAIAKELDVVDRDVKLYRKTLVDALLDRAKHSPCNQFRRFLVGYATRLRAGKRAIYWIRTWISEELVRTELSTRMFSERVVLIICQLAAALYLLLPLIASALYILNLNLVISLSVLGTPLLVALACLLKPRSIEESLRSPYAWIPLIAYLALILVVGKILPRNGPFIAWCIAIALSIPILSRLRTAERMRKYSLHLLEFVIELRRAGVDVVRALDYARTRFDDRFSEYLLNVLTLVKNGTPLSIASTMVRIPSRTLQLVLFALGIVHESGTRSLAPLQSFYETVRRIMLEEDSARRLALIFDAFAIVNVFVVAWCSQTMSALYQALPQSFASPPSLHMLIPIAAAGYAFVSSTVRRGAPVCDEYHALLAFSSHIALLAFA